MVNLGRQTLKTVAKNVTQKKSTLRKPGCFCPPTDLDLLFLRADARGHGHDHGHALLPGRAPRATRFVHVRFARLTHALPPSARHPSAGPHDIKDRPEINESMKYAGLIPTRP